MRSNFIQFRCSEELCQLHLPLVNKRWGYDAPVDWECYQCLLMRVHTCIHAWEIQRIGFGVAVLLATRSSWSQLSSSMPVSATLWIVASPSGYSAIITEDRVLERRITGSTTLIAGQLPLVSDILGGRHTFVSISYFTPYFIQINVLLESCLPEVVGHSLSVCWLPWAQKTLQGHEHIAFCFPAELEVQPEQRSMHTWRCLLFPIPFSNSCLLFMPVIILEVI